MGVHAHARSHVTSVNTVTWLVAMGNLCLSSALWNIFCSMFVICAEQHRLVKDSLNCLKGLGVLATAREPGGKVLNLLAGPCSDPHPWSWAVAGDPRVRPPIQTSWLSFLWRVAKAGERTRGTHEELEEAVVKMVWVPCWKCCPVILILNNNQHSGDASIYTGNCTVLLLMS